MPMPWLLVSASFLLGMLVAFVIEFLIVFVCVQLYEAIWTKGYVPWKRKQEIPPNTVQRELKKIKQIIERHQIEYDIKKDNPTVRKMWEEYQLLLALSDGVETFEEIELSQSRYVHCLRSDDELK